MITPRLGHYATETELDPTVRTFSIGDDARRDVVRFARENAYAAVDIETDGLAEESYTVKAIIVSNSVHSHVLNAFDPTHVEAARDAVSAAKTLIFHNSAFDVPPLIHCGAMSLADIDKVIDTLIIARMAYTDSIAGRGLGPLEKLLLATSDGKVHKDRFKEWAKINRYSISEAFKRVTYQDPVYPMYAGWDGIVTHRILWPLWEAAIGQLTNHPFGRYGADRETASYLLQREQRVNRIMLRRSARGLAVDPVRLEAEQTRLLGSQSDLAALLREHGVERPTNPNDLIAALLKVDAIPDDYPVTPKNKTPSTAADNLELLDHPAARAFTEYSKRNRQMNWLESARSIAERTDGRLHPTVGIMKAIHGRMSYALPSLQNWDAFAREMIRADDGEELTSIDWSQIEPVVGANLAHDTDALAVYESDAGGDLYSVAAEAGRVTRTEAKVVVLALLYGEQLRALAASLGMSIPDAAEVQRKVGSAIPRTDRLARWAPEWARVCGKTWTMSGRVVDVDPQFAYRATNYTICGSAYDQLSETLVAIDDRGMADHIHVVMHDEIVTTTRTKYEVAEIMRTPCDRMIELSGRIPKLRVDSADLGERWTTPK